MPDLKAIADDAIKKIKGYVDFYVAAVGKRMDEWEARLAAIPAGKDGVNGADGRPGADGKDGQPGKDGRDAETDFAQSMAAAFIEGAEHE